MLDMKEIPLPFAVEFNCGSITLEDLFSPQEAPYRNRLFSLNKMAGKKGKLTLTGVPLTTLKTSSEGDSFTVLESSWKDKLGRVLEEGTLQLTIVAGRTGLSPKAVAHLKQGDLIVLDTDLNYDLPVLIEGTGKCIGSAELLQIDSSLGFKMSHIGISPFTCVSRKGEISGRVDLGSAELTPHILPQIGEGSVINLNQFSSVQKLTLSDGTVISGYLQCFAKERLQSHSRLINDMTLNESNLVLVFIVTSPGTNISPDQIAADKKNRSEKIEEKEEIPSLHHQFSAVTTERLIAILTAMDSAASIWYMKSMGASCPVSLMTEIMKGKDEEEGASLLKNFIECRPSLTPGDIQKIMRIRFFSYLDNSEREKTREFHGEDIILKNPIDDAITVLNTLPEQKKRIYCQWLEIHEPHLWEQIKNGFFFFEDIVLLDNLSFQKLLRELDQRVLIMSQMGDESFLDRVRHKYKECMSKGAWKIFHDDASFMGKIPLSKILESRNKIVQVLAALERNGDIVIAR